MRTRGDGVEQQLDGGDHVAGEVHDGRVHEGEVGRLGAVADPGLHGSARQALQLGEDLADDALAVVRGVDQGQPPDLGHRQ